MKKKSVFSILLLSSLLFGCSGNSDSVSKPSLSQHSTVSDKGSASSKPSSVTSNKDSSSSASSSGSASTSSPSSHPSTPSTSPSTPSTSPSTPSVTPEPEPDSSVVTSIRITHKTFNLKVEETAKVEVVCFPLTATAEYTFASSDDEVCSVDSEGNLSALSSGTDHYGFYGRRKVFRYLHGKCYRRASFRCFSCSSFRCPGPQFFRIYASGGKPVQVLCCD